MRNFSRLKSLTLISLSVYRAAVSSASNWIVSAIVWSGGSACNGKEQRPIILFFPRKKKKTIPSRRAISWNASSSNFSSPESALQRRLRMESAEGERQREKGDALNRVELLPLTVRNFESNENKDARILTSPPSAPSAAVRSGDRQGGKQSRDLRNIFSGKQRKWNKNGNDYIILR